MAHQHDETRDSPDGPTYCSACSKETFLEKARRSVLDMLGPEVQNAVGALITAEREDAASEKCDCKPPDESGGGHSCGRGCHLREHSGLRRVSGKPGPYLPDVTLGQDVYLVAARIDSLKDAAAKAVDSMWDAFLSEGCDAGCECCVRTHQAMKAARAKAKGA